MTKKTLLFGLGLWAIDLCFVLFMAFFTPVSRNHLFLPVVSGLLIILIPINLYVASRMPGVK